MKGVKVNILWLGWLNLRPVLGKLVSSTFDKKRMIPYILFSVNENCQTAIIFNNLGIYLDFGRDMKEELHISLAKR